MNTDLQNLVKSTTNFLPKRIMCAVLKITAWICTSYLCQTAAQHTTNLNLDIHTLKIIHLNAITTTRTTCKTSNWSSMKYFIKMKQNETGILLNLLEMEGDIYDYSS